MNLKKFGKLTDLIKEPVQVEFPVSVKQFRDLLVENFPDLQQLNFKISVNQHLINDDAFVINNEDEIALLPPFSGG